jgi:4-hydroxy-2-oxoheptanedioate aldolase
MPARSVTNESWLVGTVVSSPDPVLAEQAAHEFDFVWIDLEHSALSVRDAATLAIAAQAGGAAALVRLPRYDSDLLSAVLDAGVDGVVAPRVQSADEAQALARAVRYPPDGLRGFAPRRAVGAVAAPGSTVSAVRVACVIQIESRQALSQLDAIASVKGVDLLVAGTADLSLELGCELDMAASELASAVMSIGEAAERHEKAWGVAIGSVPDWLGEIRSAGASMLVFSSDVRLYADAIRTCTSRLQSLELGISRSGS